MSPPLQDMPFCVAGTGDVLPMLRFISCRTVFLLDSSEPTRLGAQGRVFMSLRVSLQGAGGPADREAAGGAALRCPTCVAGVAASPPWVAARPAAPAPAQPEMKRKP